MKQVTKTAIKKFGPFLLTGLAAVAEHHWLKKDNSDSDSDQGGRRSRRGHDHHLDGEDRRDSGREDEEAEMRKLRDEVAKLRDDLKRSDLHAERNRDTVSRERKARSVPNSPRPRPPSLVRDPRALHDEDSRNSEEEGFVRMPFAPTPPMSFPSPFEQGRLVEEEEERERERAVPRPRQRYDPPRWRGSSSSSSPSSSSASSSSLCRTRDRERDRDRGLTGARARSYSRHQPHSRHFSVTRRIPHVTKIGGKKEESVIHAGKVAAVAGLVEALLVDDGKGEWIGRKGLRVGTTAAASFGATLGRDREKERGEELGRGDTGMRMREVVVDVGTGVLVSRLVYGRVRGGEEDERGRRPDGERRRWSYCL